MTEELSALVTYLGSTPDVVRRLTGELPAEALTWKPSADEFSAVEHLCHLRDLEREGYAARIEKLLAGANPFLPDIDGARLAAERDYVSQDFADALHEFARARRGNVALLETLSPSQLRSTGTLEGVGEITLEKLLHLMSEHDEAHREELSQLRGQLMASR